MTAGENRGMPFALLWRQGVPSDCLGTRASTKAEAINRRRISSSNQRRAYGAVDRQPMARCSEISTAEQGKNREQPSSPEAAESHGQPQADKLVQHDTHESCTPMVFACCGSRAECRIRKVTTEHRHASRRGNCCQSRTKGTAPAVPKCPGLWG